MEYVYGTAVINGVTRENLKIVGGPELAEGEYLTTVREYDDSTITDRCRVGVLYHSDTDEAGVRYDFYAISEHYRYIDKTAGLRNELKPITDLVRTETTQSDKLGFDWVETYVGDVVVKKEYVEQENPVGTSADNPIRYEEGVPLINNAFYLREDGKIYVYMDGWVEWEVTE